MALKFIDFRPGLRAKNRVALVGVELEGGWTTIPKGVRREEFVRDGSLDPLQRAHPEAFVMELPSPPLEPASMEEWMRKCWPQVIDAHCGMHVHISFQTSLAYSRVVREEYPGTIVKLFREWSTEERLPADHPIWDRLDGKSIYCQHVFHGDEQLKNVSKDRDQRRKGHRYTVVNFAWGRGIPTAETRLLPMFEDVEQGIRAMRFLIDITNKFLAATAAKERKVRAGFRLDEGDLVRVERRVIGV